MTLIDKSALVAEIEKRRDAALMRQRNLEAIGQVTVLDEMVANQLNRILSFINNLEAKDFDFEKELDRIWFTDGLGNHFDNDAMDFAHIRTLCRYFFELGLKAQKGEGV